MAYCTAQDIRNVLGKSATSQPDDNYLNTLADVATEFVKLKTGREFEGVTETRVFSGNGDNILKVGDYITITKIVINNEEKDINLFIFEPFNTTPKKYVRFKDKSVFPETELGNIEITGTWGYSQEVPTLIMQATAMIAASIVQSGRGQGVSPVKGNVIDASKESELFKRALEILQPYCEVFLDATD